MDVYLFLAKAAMKIASFFFFFLLFANRGNSELAVLLREVFLAYSENRSDAVILYDDSEKLSEIDMIRRLNWNIATAVQRLDPDHWNLTCALLVDTLSMNQKNLVFYLCENPEWIETTFHAISSARGALSQTKIFLFVHKVMDSIWTKYPDLACHILQFVNTGKSWESANQFGISKTNDFSPCSHATLTGTWTNGVLHLKNPRLQQKGLLRNINLKGRTVIVSAIDVPPFMELDKTANDLVLPKRGIDVLIMTTLQEYFNFKCQWITPVDKDFGVQRVDGSWTGMIGQVHTKQAEMAISAITYTKIREQAVDFSSPYFGDPLLIVTRAPWSIPSNFVLFRPFTYEIWILFFTVIFVSWGVLRASLTMERWKSSKKSFREYGIVWHLISILTMRFTPGLIPDSITTRILSAFWYFFATVVMAYYGGDLVSFMTVPDKARPLDSISDLVTGIRAGKFVSTFPQGTAYLQMFRNGSRRYREMAELFAPSNGDAGQVMQRILTDPTLSLVYVKSLMEVQAQLLGGVERFHFSREVFFEDKFVLAFQKGSQYRHLFDNAVIRMRQTGLIKHWTRVSLAFFRNKTSPEENNDEDREEAEKTEDAHSNTGLKLDQVLSMLYMLAFGYSLSVGGLLLEIIVKRRSAFIHKFKKEFH